LGSFVDRGFAIPGFDSEPSLRVFIIDGPAAGIAVRTVLAVEHSHKRSSRRANWCTTKIRRHTYTWP